MDLSGYYVICSNLGKHGPLEVSELDIDGGPIYGLIDYGAGSEEDSKSVNEYVEGSFKSWVSDPVFLDVVSDSILPLQSHNGHGLKSTINVLFCQQLGQVTHKLNVKPRHY